MKTPTLIVRLAGIYLLVTSSHALYTLGKLPAPQAFTPELIKEQLDNAKYLHGFLAFVGLIAARYAGALAKILTFDAERQSKHLADRVYTADTTTPPAAD